MLYFFQILALVAMIYGFVMIQSPEKTFNGSHAVEEVIHEEVEAEEGVADIEELELEEEQETTTDLILTELKNGTMDPHSDKYKELGLLRIQKHGIKGKRKQFRRYSVIKILWILISFYTFQL